MFYQPQFSASLTPLDEADEAAEFVPKPFRLLTPSIYSIKSG